MYVQYTLITNYIERDCLHIVNFLGIAYIYLYIFRLH